MSSRSKLYEGIQSQSTSSSRRQEVEEESDLSAGTFVDIIFAPEQVCYDAVGIFMVNTCIKVKKG